MDKVKKLVDAGAKLSTAIKEALSPRTIADFADEHGLHRSALSNAINGNVRATDAMIEALIAEFGGSADEWREHLWKAAKPEPTAKAS